MKKLRFKIIGALIFLLLFTASYEYFHFSRDVSYEDMVQESIKSGLSEKISEKVGCGSTNPPRCFKYKCESGYIYSEPIPPPGGLELKCTDGSVIKEIGEVPFQSD